MAKMKAAIFVEPGRIVLDDKPVPDVGPLDALMRVTTTTLCGTDVHILKGEYPVARGLTIGHEPVGVRQHRDGHSWGGIHQRHPPGLSGDQGDSLDRSSRDPGEVCTLTGVALWAPTRRPPR